MNIFVLDTDPKKCAHYHTDKHVLKMILEHAQMMSVAVRKSGIEAGYNITHATHPCTLWVCESLSNYNWLKELTYYLHREWRLRFVHTKDHNHKSWIMVKDLPTPNIEDKGLTPFVQCMPEKYQGGSAVKAYRRYYLSEKRDLFKWSNRGKPKWVKKALKDEKFMKELKKLRKQDD